MSLLETIGGEDAAAALAKNFTLRVATETDLQNLFDGIHFPDLQKNRTQFLIATLSGGGFPSGYNSNFINDEQFDTFVGFIAESLFDKQAGDDVIQNVLNALEAGRRNSVGTNVPDVVKITLKLPKTSQRVTVNIHNQPAHNRRMMVIGTVNAGQYTVEWDKKDDYGNPFPKGEYEVEMFVDDLLARQIKGVLK